MRYLLFFLFLFPLLVSAQPREDGYVHDVIYPPQVNTTENVEKSWESNGLVANCIATGLVSANYDYRTHTYYDFKWQFTKSHYILANTSQGFLRKIDVTTRSGVSTDITPYSITVYSSPTPITNIEEIKENRSNYTVRTLKFVDDVTLQSFDIDGADSHIAIISDYAYMIKSIDFGWQQTSYSRADLVKDDLGTLCLPYSASSFSGFTPYTIKGKTVDGAGQIESIVFEESKDIVAGVPYVFVANGTEINIELSGERAITTAGHHNGLYGTFVDYPFASDNDFRENDHDYLVINADNCFQAASAKSGVRANRAFIKVKDIPLLSEANSQGRQLVLTADGYKVDNGTTTYVVSSTAPLTTNDVYTIDGRHTPCNAVPALRVSNGRKELRPATH